MAEGAAPSDGHFHGEVPSNLGQDNNAQEVQPRGALRDAPSREGHMLAVGRPPSSSTKSLGKAIQDALGCEEHSLAVGRPPSSSTESRGKAIEDYDQENDGEASSTKIIPKANAEAGPSVRAPAKHDDEVVAAIGGPAHPNATDVASNATPAIPAIAQQDDNIALGGGVGGGRPALAQINGGGGNAAIAAHPALAQPNAGGPAPNAAPPVPVLPPNPGVNYIDEVLMNSSIRPLRNPDEGKFWDKLN